MFQAKPTTYALEHNQVLFAASWLKDNALRHWTALLWNNPNHPALHQWGAYIKEFTSIFGPHNAAHDAEITLSNLKCSTITDSVTSLYDLKQKPLKLDGIIKPLPSISAPLSPPVYEKAFELWHLLCPMPN